MNHGSFRALMQLLVLSISGLCASCVPMSLRYYVPSAEGAKLLSYSCPGDPPYRAGFVGRASPQFTVWVGLAQQLLTGNDDPTLTLIIHPFPSALIAIDPALIRVEADGQPVQPKSIQYYVGKSASAPALESHGPINIQTDHLIIDLPLGISGALDVVTHLPPITVGGEVNQLPDVSFKLEKHTQLIALNGKCCISFIYCFPKLDG
jgi:hypothetical protein